MKHFGFLERGHESAPAFPDSKLWSRAGSNRRPRDCETTRSFQLSYGPLKLEIEVLIFERAAESTNLGWESTGYGQARSLRRT